MTDSFREQALTVLQHDWASYVERFQRLPAEAQAAFLDQQGYERLADLLAHITAWWRDGLAMISRLEEEPSLAPPVHDVDAFNARAVAGVAGQDEAAVIAAFEATRQQMVQLLAGLPASAWENERLAGRVRMEVIGHLSEHALPTA